MSNGAERGGGVMGSSSCLVSPVKNSPAQNGKGNDLPIVYSSPSSVKPHSAPRSRPLPLRPPPPATQPRSTICHCLRCPMAVSSYRFPRIVSQSNRQPGNLPMGPPQGFWRKSRQVHCTCHAAWAMRLQGTGGGGGGQQGHCPTAAAHFGSAP